MKRFLRLLVPSVVCVVLVAAVAVRAQTNDGPNDSTKGRDKQKAADIPLADRFRELDKNSDAKLTREELGVGLFEFLNANSDDAVTLDEAREVIRVKGADALRKVARTTPPPAAPPVAPTTTSPPKSDAKPVASKSDESLREGPQRLTPGDHGIGRRLPDLKFTDIDGRSFSLSDLREKRAVVIAFTNTTCPLCKKYAPTLASLEKQFADRLVAFVFVNPTSNEKPEALRAAIQSHGWNGSYVQDTDGAIARALGATHTTDAFVIDPGGRSSIAARSMTRTGSATRRKHRERSI